jgi:hypothetical protein
LREAPRDTANEHRAAIKLLVKMNYIGIWDALHAKNEHFLVGGGKLNKPTADFGETACCVSPTKKMWRIVLDPIQNSKI